MIHISIEIGSNNGQNILKYDGSMFYILDKLIG